MYGTYIFTLLNFPQGTLFNRVNPIRAGLLKDVDELSTYPYCGHSVVMGNVKHGWQNVQEVCGMCGGSHGHGRRSYRKFVEKGITPRANDTI